MVLFPSEASSLRPGSAVWAGSGASAGRHTGAVAGRAGPLDRLNVIRDTIPSTRDFIERHPSTYGLINAIGTGPTSAACSAERRLDLTRGDGAVRAAEDSRVGGHSAGAVSDRGAAVGAALGNDADAALGGPGAATAAVDLAVLTDHAGGRDQGGRAAGAGFVDRELVSEVQAFHGRLGSRARAEALAVVLVRRDVEVFVRRRPVGVVASDQAEALPEVQEQGDE